MLKKVSELEGAALETFRTKAAMNSIPQPVIDTTVLRGLWPSYEYVVARDEAIDGLWWKIVPYFIGVSPALSCEAGLKSLYRQQ